MDLTGFFCYSYLSNFGGFMGYCVSMELSVKIPLEKEKEIKKAFKKLESEVQSKGGGGHGEPENKLVIIHG